MYPRRSLLTLLIVLVAISGAGSAPVWGDVVGYYSPDTGDFSLLVGPEPPDSLLCYVLIPNAPNQFRSDNHRPILDVVLYDAVPFQIGECRKFPPLDPGLYSLGRILPEGLSAASFEDFFQRRSYVSQLGAGANLSIDLHYGPSDQQPINGDDPTDPEPVISAQEVDLIYNWHTGDVTVDSSGPRGGVILSIQLFDSEDRFNWDRTTVEPGPHDFEPGHFGYIDDRGIPAGLFELGPVLPPDLTLDDLRSSISGYFIAKPGSKIPAVISGPGDLSADWSTLSLTIVPEPGMSGVVMALGLAAWARRRRRSSNR